MNTFRKRPRLIPKGELGLDLSSLFGNIDFSKFIGSGSFSGTPGAPGSSLNTGAMDVMKNIAANGNFGGFVKKALPTKVSDLLTPPEKLPSATDAFPSSSTVNAISKTGTGALAKGNAFLNKGIGNTGITYGAVADLGLGIADAAIPKAEDKASRITSGVLKGAASIANKIPGGQVVGLPLQAAGMLFGAGVKKVAGNKADELVDSSASYTGEDRLDSKRFGILGLGSAKRYKKKVAQRQLERDTAHGILTEGQDDRLAATNVQQYSLADRLNKGAANWMYGIRAGKGGMKMRIKRMASLAKVEAMKASLRASKAVPETAGTSNQAKNKTAAEGLEMLKNGGKKDRPMEELVKVAKEQNPRFMQRLEEEPAGIPFTLDGEEHYGSHMMESADEIVYPRIQEVDGKLTWFGDPEEARENALKTGDYVRFGTEGEAVRFAKGYKEFFKDWFDRFDAKYKDGGKLNVIPDGALHARLHGLGDADPDLDGSITRKGIPVITKDKDGGITQHAEIERSEIIFTLEVTEKLEEMRKRYKDGDDDAALEAGKLLAREIMENTKDNTGELINEGDGKRKDV